MRHGWRGPARGGVDAVPQARHGAGMSILAEIEEALPKLTSGELLRVEAVLRRIQREQGGFAGTERQSSVARSRCAPGTARLGLAQGRRAGRGGA